MPPENNSEKKKSISIDWLLRGSLTKIGDIFDRLTGRNWKPSSSLATSELIEKLKALLDGEAKNLGKKGIFVPHNLKLKIQWDKFSLDSDESLQKLEQEILTAIIDHINDNRYHTYAPIKLQIKPDYFTEGVKLLASFDKFAEEESEAAINLSVPKLENIVIPTVPQPEEKIEKEKEIVKAKFDLRGKTVSLELEFGEGERLNVGRTKDNALILEDGSVSKIHAALVINNQKKLMVADTGSTNGTFINGKRIAYGKAFEVNSGDKLKFGNVEVEFEYTPKEIPLKTVAVENFQPESAKVTEELKIETVRAENLPETRQMQKEEVLPQTAVGLVSPNENKEKPVPKPHITLKPLGQKTPQPVPPVSFSDESTLTDLKEEIKSTDLKDEELTPKTAQGIVFDFGDEK